VAVHIGERIISWTWS